MRQSILTFTVLGILGLNTLSAQTLRYTTTRAHNGSPSIGNAELSQNKVEIHLGTEIATIYEEANISIPQRNELRGDPNSIEINYDFSLDPGNFIQSLLLWNGNQILKAKLMDANEAFKAYEAVVDRDVINIKPRDPAFIRQISSSRYQLSIYPVSLGGTRKIRIRYAIPLESLGSMQTFLWRPLFSDADLSPKELELKIVKPDSLDVLLNNQGAILNIKNNVNYLVPYKTFERWYSNSNPAGKLRITTTYKTPPSSLSFHDTRSYSAGYYHVAKTKIPTEIYAYIKEQSPQTWNISATVSTGTNSYGSTALRPQDSLVTLYIKSSQAWDQKIQWTLADQNGKVALEHTQAISNLRQDSLAALLWAAKATQNQSAISYGALFGYVDAKMALLALEKDTLPQSLYAQYQNSGVPLLNPNEIQIEASKLPVLPEEQAIFEYNSLTGTHSLNLQFALQIQNNLLHAQLQSPSSEPIQAVILGANGQVIQKLKAIEAHSQEASWELKLPRGSYWLRLSTSQGHITQAFRL
jgi:hypothetical protein